MTRLFFAVPAVALIAFAAAGLPLHAQAQGGPPLAPPPTISGQPQPATVGFGAGVSFSVSARAAPRDFITGFRWYRDGLPVAQGLNLATYSIAATDAFSAGNYTVEVSSLTGSTLSLAARLTVVSGGWARLGGRAVSHNAAAQPPALSLCDGAKLAWVQTNAAGIDELRVSRFIGTGWVQMGAVLNQSATAHAAEPSIDCSDWAPAGAVGPQQPVVAWSEGSGNARAIQVKAWNGAAWVAVLGGSGAISGAGANARKPVLRLAPNDPHWISNASIRALSALSWTENGVARAKHWNGADWQTYIGGHPGSTVQGDVALIHDTRYVTANGGASVYPPLLAHVAPLGPVGLGQSTLTVQVNSIGGWTALGQTPGPLGGVAAPLRLAGIGFGTQRIGDGAVAVWASHNNGNFSIGSAQLFGPDYTNALRHPFDPPPAWAAHANPATGFDLNALSMDPRALQTQCPSTDRRVSFAIAVNDFNGTRVLRSVCKGTVAAPLDWEEVGSPHPGRASAVSLRMESESTPVFAELVPGSGASDLSVWRFYR